MKTRKFIKQYLLLAFVGLFAVGCFDNIPEEQELPMPPVSFNYRVFGGDPRFMLDYYVYSTILFLSTSGLDGVHTWDFGDGTVVTSERNDSVFHTYEVAGNYTVTLTVGDKSLRQPIRIQDIRPIMWVVPLEDGEVHEVLRTPVEIEVLLPNPRNLPVEFEWFFPSRTFTENMDPITAYSDINPGALIFGNVGSQQVRLQVRLGGRPLPAGIVNVPVGFYEPVPTLYYAVRNGNIMALKILPDNLSDTAIVNMPFDTGVPSGATPKSILYHDGLIYLLDPGERFTFEDDSEEHNRGDGQIRVMTTDGSRVEIMLQNRGHAFNDPFKGFIEGNTLYFTDRNSGIMAVPLTLRNAMFTYRQWDMPRFVANNRLCYFGTLLPYGALNSDLTRIDGVWYWGKRWNAWGMYRFTNNDIQMSNVVGGQCAYPASGHILPNLNMSAFVFDRGRGTRPATMYFAVYNPGFEGLYRATIEQMEGITNTAGLAPFKLTTTGTAAGFSPVPITDGRRLEGTNLEPIAISQLTVVEETGMVYFALRSGAPDEMETGIWRFNPATNRIEPVLLGVSALGVTINNNRTRLF